MIKQHRIFFIFLISVIILSCKKASTNQNVQNNCTISKASSTPLNYTMLAGSGAFFPISIVGGVTYLNGYGINGIVIYRVSQSQFVALERNCTKDGCTNARAYVWLLPGNTSLKDSACGSVFSALDGSVQNGPATIPLYQYHTSWDGNQLVIHN